MNIFKKIRTFFGKNKKIEIRSYSEENHKDFEKLFINYWLMDLKNDHTVDVIKIKVINECIVPHLKKGATFADMIYENNKPVGFILYQVDKSISDWCKREGWGFIREFHIEKTHRKRGYGSMMVGHMESKLKEKNVKNIYLTTDNDVAKLFYKSCFYLDSGEIDDTNNGSIFVKSLEN